jgi:hypothetical protein
MQRCADCKHVDTDDSEGYRSYRCGATVPFWVPLPLHDYASWVIVPVVIVLSQ